MKAPSETAIPLAENERAQLLLARLRREPASTLALQTELPLVHVARQVWELRHWYGFNVRTSRLPNNVALYTLIAGPRNAHGPTCPRCGGDLVLLDDQLLDARFVVGKCASHGRQTVRAA